MTPDELRTLYTEAYKLVQAERKMRLYVFRDQPDKLLVKMGEMDRLLLILTKMKDELKKHIGAGIEQPLLLDVPRKAEYR